MVKPMQNSPTTSRNSLKGCIMNKNLPTTNTPDYTPYSPPTSEVTVDRITEEISLASRWKRLAATLIDILIFLLPFLFLPLAFALSSGDYSSSIEMGFDINQKITLSIVALLFIAILTINLIFIIKKSASIGKVLLKIKIIRSNGEKCSAIRIIGLRIILNTIFGMIPVLGTVYVFIDPLFIFNKRKQCIHDFLADTLVVDV
jgi:uncharacterized RDD family membrane protein YckC